MNIRQQQLRSLANEMETRFVARMVAHLRESFPQELTKAGLISDEEIRSLVRRGLAESAKYEVVNEGDVQRYIECMVLLSPQFDTDYAFPWAREILWRTDIDGESKMDQIDEYLIFRGAER